MIYDLSKVPAETRALIESEPRFVRWFSEFPKQLFSISADSKTIKGEAKGFLTAILYLSPSDMSGVQLCAMSYVAGCREGCLGHAAGRNRFTVNQIAKLRKTLYFLQYREQFLAQMQREIRAAKRKADRKGAILVVRPNGATDIQWERFGIIQANPDVQFYDYTKLVNRRNIPANYDLTFSYSGVPEYQRFVQAAVAKRMRIAVVFRTRDTVESMLGKGETFLDLPIVDGDDSDVRHIDPAGSVVALYAKGKARQDNSGFVA
jgi:hypothetical protein